MALGTRNSMNFCSACRFNWPIGSMGFPSCERSMIQETADIWLELQGLSILSTKVLYRAISASAGQARTSALSLQQCSCSNTDLGAAQSQNSVQNLPNVKEHFLFTQQSSLHQNNICLLYQIKSFSEDSSVCFSHLTVIEKTNIDTKFCLLLQRWIFSSCIYIAKRQFQTELCLKKSKFRCGMYTYCCTVIINTQNAMCSGS